MNTALPSNRLDSIDALRGIAALMVAGYHIWGHYGVYPFPSIGVVPQAINPSIFSYLVSPLRWGYLGVSLFLVLSGFCIHLPFARKRKESGNYQFVSRQFYLRRLWRLYPAYAVSVVGTYLLLTLTSRTTHLVDSSPTLGDLAAHLTLTHGYFDNYFYGIVSVYWSLALEFQLYLAYPVFLYVFRKMGLTQSIVALTVISIVWRILSLDVFHSNLISISSTGPYAMMGFLFARMPEWLFGVFVAEWFVRGKQLAMSRWPLVAASAIVLFSAILSSLSSNLWSLTDILFGLGFAFAIAASITPGRASSSIPIARNYMRRPYKTLVWVGTISYSLYLFHMQLSWFANSWIRGLPGAGVPFILRTIILVCSIPVIAVIYRFVEAPFLKPPKQGDRYFALYARIRKFIGIKTDASLPIQFGGSQP